MAEDNNVKAEEERTTITVSKNLIEKINKLKIHPRQTHEEIIEEAMDFMRKNKK